MFGFPATAVKSKQKAEAARTDANSKLLQRMIFIFMNQVLPNRTERGCAKQIDQHFRGILAGGKGQWSFCITKLARITTLLHMHNKTELCRAVQKHTAPA